MICSRFYTKDSDQDLKNRVLTQGLLCILYRLQNSYTASQRTNQELEDKLHTLVICPGGQFGRHCAHGIAGG